MSAADRLAWRWRRLRSMGASEMIYRARQAVQLRQERHGWGLAGAGNPAGPCGLPWVSALPRNFDPMPYVAAADTILAGRFSIFALRDARLGFPPRWHVDPKTGIEAPSGFGKAIDYRDRDRVGDIKYLWEINRHLELVTLAQAWHLTGEGRFAIGCQQMLDSWFEECPYPQGLNWTSSLEVGLRLVNWAVAWHLLGGEGAAICRRGGGEKFRERWLQSVRQHCHFISGWFSRYSSANNHLLGEYMGLFVGATTWPLWPESAAWRRNAHAGLEREVLLQNAADGVNREQATWYQHEVMDMMLICGLFGRSNGMEFSPAFWDRLERMMEFIGAVTDRSGNVPMIGDADDAVMIRWSRCPDWHPYGSLLATGAVLYVRTDWAARATRFDDKSRWLLGDAAAESFDRLPRDRTAMRRREFPEGGYYVMGGRFGEPDELRVVVDCGPLGYQSIAAHGHADALALTLSAGGCPVLVDSGTYAYHADDEWRSYFRSTRAHNTLCVDGEDQSESGGNFMWMTRAAATCTRAELQDDVQWFAGEHDGYCRLPDPVTHRRSVELRLPDNLLIVRDDLDCTGKHVAEICWHFSREAEVSQTAEGLIVEVGRLRLSMTVEGDAADLHLHRGESSPPAGWMSEAYDVKYPATTAVWRAESTGNRRFTTIIRVEYPWPIS